MTISLETELVRQCAPTLAGLKPASLFRYVFAPGQDPARALFAVTQALETKGIRVQILSYHLASRGALFYGFRPWELHQILKEPANSSFLKRQGYTGSCEEILDAMALRLSRKGSFPHEIGLLLGYPLEDVKAYMAAPREKGVCSGCWKAYGNREQAACYFAKCRKCTQVYWRCYCAGTPLSRLAVA